MQILTESPIIKLKSLLAKPSPFPYLFNSDGSKSLICYSGQAAIYHAVRVLGIQVPGEILMPAYHCGAEISSVEAAGLKPVFYRVDSNAQVDLSDLSDRINQSTRVIYLTHFFGFPGPVEAISEIAKRHRLPLIEDCAPAIFTMHNGKFVGTCSEAAIFSLSKCLSVPDGGILKLNNNQAIEFPILKNQPVDEKIRKLRWIVSSVLKRHLKMNEEIGPCSWDELDKGNVGENEFQVLSSKWKESWITKRIFNSLDWERIVAQRKKNFQTLLKYIEPLITDSITPLYHKLPAGTCPWVMPLKTSDPLGLKAALRKRGIGAVAVWTLFHPAFDPDIYPEAAALKRHVLGLPVHQDMSEKDMIRIVSTLKNILES